MASSLTNATFKNFELSNIKQLELTICDTYESLLDIEANILSPFKMLKILDLSKSAFSLKHSLKLWHYYIDQSTIRLDLLNNRWRCRNSYTRIGHSLYRDLHSDVTLTNCEVV
jgi:hypothetical protein